MKTNLKGKIFFLLVFFCTSFLCISIKAENSNVTIARIKLASDFDTYNEVEIDLENPESKERIVVSNKISKETLKEIERLPQVNSIFVSETEIIYSDRYANSNPQNKQVILNPHLDGTQTTGFFIKNIPPLELISQEHIVVHSGLEVFKRKIPDFKNWVPCLVSQSLMEENNLSLYEMFSLSNKIYFIPLENNTEKSQYDIYSKCIVEKEIKLLPIGIFTPKNAGNEIETLALENTIFLPTSEILEICQYRRERVFELARKTYNHLDWWNQFVCEYTDSDRYELIDDVTIILSDSSHVNDFEKNVKKFLPLYFELVFEEI